MKFVKNKILQKQLGPIDELCFGCYHRKLKNNHQNTSERDKPYSEWISNPSIAK